MLIYKITNLKNGKVYVGKTGQGIEKRFRKHVANAKKGINRYLYDAMNKYGVENFSIEVIEEVLDPSLVDERERYWISILCSLMPNGYNMTEGGEGGNTLKNWSEERKKEHYKKQGDARRGPRPPEWRKAISEASKGKFDRMSPEDKSYFFSKVSETLKRKYASGEIVATTPKLAGEAHPQWIEIDFDMVMEKIKEGVSLKDIASICGCTYNTLSTRLKLATGKTYTEWKRHFKTTPYLRRTYNTVD